MLYSTKRMKVSLFITEVKIDKSQTTFPNILVGLFSQTHTEQTLVKPTEVNKKNLNKKVFFLIE